MKKNRNISLNEKNIRSIVSDSIGSILECTDILPNDYWWEEEIMFDSPCILLNEGLIKSYPINDVINAIARANSLVVGNKMYEILKGDNKDSKGCIYLFPSPNKNTNLIYVIIPKGTINKNAIDKKMVKYGWICTKEMEYINSPHYQKLLYERKFDISANNLVFQQKYLYHICPNNKVNKILRQGLLPKENTWQSWNIDNDLRIYFFLDIPNDSFLSLWKGEFNAGKKTAHINDGFTLLKVDVGKINQNNFYYDPRVRNGVYTRDAISPTAIEKVREI